MNPVQIHQIRLGISIGQEKRKGHNISFLT